MDAALAALDRGVRALFAEPGAALAASSAHPLCECMLQYAPPPDWRYLQRFPVLKRHVLTQFCLVAVEVEKQPQTPRKRKKRSILQQSGNAEDFRAVCVASLGQKLAQCGLLTLSEAEIVNILVTTETLDVLRRVIGGRLLPLRLRMLLLGFALQRVEKRALETAEQSWIKEVCEKVLEEAREATATGGSKEPSSKRVRTRPGDRKDVDTAEKEEKLCGFCRDGATAESLRSESGGWDFLVECTHRVTKTLEKSGESYATNEAMAALSAFWDSLPVAGLSSEIPGRRRKRAEISVKVEKGREPSLSISGYERIVQSVVGSIAGEFSAAQVMWKKVWEREARSMANEKQVTLPDVIRHCSKADAFSSIVLPKQKYVAYFPGYRVVVEAIRSLRIGVSGIITAFARVWRASQIRDSGGISRVTVPIGSGASSAKHILRSYLSALLKTPLSPGKLDVSTGVPPLELLSALYEIFSQSTPGHQQIDSYSEDWDAFMIQSCEEMSPNDSNQDGINWLLNLEQCLVGMESKVRMVTRYGDHFSATLQNYCLAIMHGVVASGGETISSGGTMKLQLIGEESDRSTVRRGFSVMMATFGDDWIAGLIAELLRGNTSLRGTEGAHQRGVRSLLFPALVTSMKSNSRSQQKTGQQQFLRLIHAVNIVLKESEPTPLYLVQLMGFCRAWDAYQSSHTKEPPTRTNKWGIRAMIELDMVSELLDCYGRDDVVHKETSEALTFAAEVLQNGTNCPPSLEGLLYKVVSALKEGAESVKSSISGPLETTDKQLVSHSSDVLQRLLRAVKFADLAQTRQLMSQVKDVVGTLSELRQQLERWFSFVEMHGAAFAGRESRMELAVLCTRLIRWFPDDFDSMRLLLMTPLDSHLIAALRVFVKEAGKTSSAVEQKSFGSSASSLPAAVRVEMALHLYLSAAAFPDLEALTTLLTKAMVKCRSADAFNHLAKAAEKNARILLPEAAVATLSSPLRGLEFSATGANHIEYEDDDDARVKDYARLAKSVIYQENALKLLAMSACVYGGGISWSPVLFGDQAAVVWFPYFFEYILKTDMSGGSQRVNALLACLEELTQSEAQQALQQGFWIAALLNTALVACSSRSAGAYEDPGGEIYDRLRAIAHKVLNLLVIAPSKTFKGAGATTTGQYDAILSVVNKSKCAWLIIDEENDARSSLERIIDEKTARSLRMILSVTATEAKAVAVESPIQLFLPFSHWLSGALVYSQSFLEEPSATMRRWERTFTSYVTDLYLRLQFEDDACSLLEAWLSTWVSSNIVRSQEEQQLLALLPSQVALFRRLGLTPYRSQSPCGKSQVSTSIWQLVFAAINLAVDHHTSENPASIDQATELVVSTLTTLELVELSASSDFAHFIRTQELEPFFTELGQFLSRPQLRACSAAQVFCLLQYPLELLVCCYACKIPADFEAESQLFVQRSTEVFHENFSTNTDEVSDGTTESAVQEEASTEEMDAFLRYWADEMLLKYDYIDRERCESVLAAIQAAIQGEGGVQ